MATSSDHIAGLLAFFELWNFPLTLEEIRRFFAAGSITEDDLKRIFFWKEDSKGKIFFSTNQEVSRLIALRKESEQISEQLQQRAERFLRILRHFPFIRGLALTNTPAMGVATSESDIDLFVIATPGRIWTARFFSTLFFHLLGLRVRKGKTKGKFCLSFFVTTDSLDFLPLKEEKDIYLALWLATMKPFCGRNFFQKLQEMNQSWVRKETGIELVFADSFLMAMSSEKSSRWQRIWEFLLPIGIEAAFRKLLLSKSRRFRDPNSPDYDPAMIFSEQIQKLHHPDLRTEIQKRWEGKRQGFFALKPLPVAPHIREKEAT